MAKRDLISIDDFSVEEIDELLELAEDIRQNPEKYHESCAHKILATLFYEPSTRTRLSFESAMYELGGNVIGFSDANSSSVSKGEDVPDTARVIAQFADMIAMRHPDEGAPELAAKYVDIPVINAGDGGHMHPTQTLTDMYTIIREKGRFSNLKIGMCGDLKYGRTVHSLIQAFLRYDDVEYYLISPCELEIPDYVREWMDEKSVIYHEVRTIEECISELDILYMTRIQQERFESEEEYNKLKDSFILDTSKLELARDDMIVLHPMPIVNEITGDVDKDPRAKYFEQVLNGKIVRKALIVTLFNSMK